VYLKYKSFKYSFVFLFLLVVAYGQANGQIVLPLDQKNSLTGEWLVYKEKSKQLIPFIESAHTDKYALHQWISIASTKPFLIGVNAPKDLCLFINNRLIFKADSSSIYKLNLAEYQNGLHPVKGKYLLTVWHPSQQPKIESLYNELLVGANEVSISHRPISIKIRDYVNQNAFILFLLLVGLIYGLLRVNYPNDFNGLFKAGLSNHAVGVDETAGLAKPISSWSSILFILAFSISLALLIAAIHTNVQHILLFNRLLPVSEADVATRIGVYTIFIFGFVLLKYLFLKVMAYIFGLEEVVQMQYAEFIRTLLFVGIFLPFIMLLYLSMNVSIPEVILLVSNVLVSLLLILTTYKVFVAVNKKATVLNLHLFSYLCATEVIPLAIVLKLIVFSF
jgi:hypothetical protein